MDFGLVLGILIVVAIGVYIWMSRENDKLDGLDESFPSDCSVDTKPDVTAPPKAEPVFAKAVLAPDAAEDAAVAKAEAAAPKAKPAPKAKAPSITREELTAMTKKQIDEFALAKGVELDRRKKKGEMVDELLDSLK
jgi:hypothetical protein